METFLAGAQAVGVYGLIALLCIVGLLGSCLALSGTWLVVLATAIAALYRPGLFPAWWIVLTFALFSALIEVIEFFASAWGVQRRGGSRLAGFAAVAGGLAGMLLGAFIPVPVLGPLLGMVAGSFGLAYLVEYKRLQKREQATHIATGAVIARISIVFLKVVATLGMALIIGVGMLFSQ